MEIVVAAIIVLVPLAWIGSDVISRLKRMESRINWLDQRLQHGLRTLGVEPEDSAPALAVHSLLEDGKELQAIRLWRQATGASLKESKAYVDGVAAERESGR